MKTKAKLFLAGVAATITALTFMSGYGELAAIGVLTGIAAVVNVIDVLNA